MGKGIRKRYRVGIRSPLPGTDIFGSEKLPEFKKDV